MNVVYNSFGGRYSDNPKAIHQQLAVLRPDWNHVWIAASDHAHGFPSDVATVPSTGTACVEALESADVVISNTHIELDWTKAAGAAYIQTWHGTPLKRIHFDVLFAPPGRLEYLSEDVRRWDHLLSPNSASTDLLRRAFGFSGAIAETGYPRNDVLVAANSHEVRARVRSQLGIDDDTTAVLYTPTWRDNFDEAGGLAFEQHLDLEQFSQRLGDSHVLLLRLHYMLSDRLGPLAGSSVLDVSMYPDIAELYLAADVLITDYSSTMFDFAVTGKPMLFYTFDLEHYRDTLRGFYFDFTDLAPGPLLPTSTAVIDALTDLDALQDEHADAYARFRERFCHLEDGFATQRVIDRFFGVNESGAAAPLPTTTAEVV